MSFGALLGGIADGIGALVGAERASSEASKQRGFQREMAQNAIQRQVADLKAAGLNPILAAQYGGAAVPSGAKGDIPQLGNIGRGMQAGASAAHSVAQAKQASAEAKLSENAIKYYEKNSAFKEAIDAGKLASMAGLSGKYQAAAVAAGGARSAVDAIRKVPEVNKALKEIRSWGNKPAIPGKDFLKKNDYPGRTN